MTARKHILDTLAGLSDDNRPTPERQSKSQFTIHNDIWKTRTIAERLHGTERIDGPTFDAAKAWTTNYILLNDGPGALEQHGVSSNIKHDRISWIMTQAKRRDSIAAIRDYVGKSYHNLLVLTLYDCYSANSIAGMMGNSDYKNSSLCKYIDQECIKAYKKLSEFFDIYYRNGVGPDKSMKE